MIRTVEEEKSVDDLYRLALGKTTSSVLEVAVDLEVFTKIRGRSVSLEELENILSMPPASVRMLAQFLCREGLMTYRDGKVTNTPVAEKFLTSENLIHREIKELRRYAVTAEQVRARLMAPAGQHRYQTLTDEQFYYNNNPRRVAWGEELAQRYDFSRHRRLLDVAGSSGGLSIGIRKHYPHLQGILFDLPKSEPFAAKVIGDAGQTGGISFVGGSFLTDELPRGADVALVANVLHNWPREEDLLILRKIHDALEPGGVLLVFELFFEDDWTGPMEAIMQTFILGDRGWQPSFEEMEQLLAEAGFVDLERRYTSLLIGHKKSA